MTLVSDKPRTFECDSCEKRSVEPRGWQERPDRITRDKFHYCPDCLAKGYL